MSQQRSQARHDYIDYLRGLLVLLVAYGHTIQYIAYRNNAAAFFDDPLFKLIYIFHMPLFMAVSGFVSFYSLARNSASETIKKRVCQLIIPIVSWAMISRSALFFPYVDLRSSNTFEQLLLLLKAIVHETLDSFWFLWCVFGATLVVLILRTVKADTALSLTLVSFLLLFLPDFSKLYMFKYMLPFFCAGYLWSKNSSFYSQRKISLLKIAVGLMVSLVCFLLWKHKTYVYISKMSFTNGNATNIILMYVGGFILSLTFVMLTFWLFHKNFRHPFLYELGKSSLAIYILQTYVFFVIERKSPSFEMNLFVLHVLSLLIAIVICVTAYYFARLLYHYPLPSKLLLGGLVKTNT